MPIKDTVVVVYIYSWPHLDHYRDPVWVIQYSTVHIEIIVGYIQFFPVSASLEKAGITHVKRDEEIWINET